MGKHGGVIAGTREDPQADALTLVTKKLQSSLDVEGELPEDGLAAYGDDGDDLMLALARKIVVGDEDADSVGSSSGRPGGSRPRPGRCPWTRAGLRRSLVRAGVVAVGATSSDGRDDAGEVQRMLFSWAEFMAGEPVKLQRRRQDEDPALSLFEWG